MSTELVAKIRNIFNDSQHLHRHQKCLKQINELYEKHSSEEQLLAEFTAEFSRDLLFALNLEPKSPYTKHIIEFVAKYLQSFAKPAEKEPENDGDGDTTIIDEEMAAQLANDSVNLSNQENQIPNDSVNTEDFDELGMESFGSESFTTSKRQSTTAAEIESEDILSFLEVILKDKLIPFLFNKKLQIRYNSCVLIRRLFTDIEDIDFDVYKKLKKSLLERLRDKDKLVRSAAALALHRFQEVDDDEDVVTNGLKFHLNSDPDFRVRHSCLLSLQPTAKNIDHLISSTRDVKDIIRKTAFTVITDKYDVKNVGIGKRLQILKSGINERNPIVQRVVITKMIPKWIKLYDEDICQFLFALDIGSDPEFIERMLFFYFDHLRQQTIDESADKTGFHQFLQQFKTRFLEDHNLLVKEDLTVENSFLWRIVAKYCKEKDITLTVTTVGSTATPTEDLPDTDSQPIESNVETVDAIDTIVPDLPHYCRFLKIFVRQLLESELELHDLMEFEFMFYQLILMGELIEIGDSAQKQILYKTIIDLLENKELFQRAHNFIRHLLKILANNLDQSSLLDTTITVIDKINSESLDIDDNSQPVTEVVEEVVVNKETIEKQLRQFELEYAKLSIRVESLKDDFESAVNDGNDVEAQKINELMDSLNLRMKEVMDKRLGITRIPEPSSQASQTKSKDTLTDDPIALERCLQILCGCLEFGKFQTISPIIITLIERLVLPSVINSEITIRNLSVKALGLSCLISPELSKQHFLLLSQVFKYDSNEAQETALESIFDILCFHGLNLFEQKSKDKQKSDLNNKTLTDSRKSVENTNESHRQNSISEDNVDEEENEKTIINYDENDVLCSDSEGDGDEEEESFISVFIELVENNLNSDSDSIRFITAKGIAKLFILGRIYSPQILSKLLIQWYDTDSNEEMRQFLGAFFPIYSGVQMKANLKGENAFEECFIKTVETVFDEGLSFVDLNNLINFVLQLVSDAGHKSLAKSVANQILTRLGANGLDDTLTHNYYLKVLSMLRLTEMSSIDIKEYKLLIDKIQRKLNRLKSKPKILANRMQMIKSKIDKQIDLIRENASQVSTIEDFGSLSLSQSLSERSQIDETIIETNS